MAVTNEFREAVLTGKKMRVRIMLKDMMLIDPTMKQFDEMLDFAGEHIPDLFDEHNGEAFPYDRSEWNEACLNRQMVTVVNNFSRERIELLRSMVKSIYHGEADNRNVEHPAQNTAAITKKQVGIGVAAVGAAVAAAGICAQQGLLIAGGVVTAAVGIGLIVTDREA